MTIEGHVKRVTHVFKLTASLSCGASVHALSKLLLYNQRICGHIFYCNIPFFSVFIDCTVLFNFASTVMIKWWLSSSVTPFAVWLGLCWFSGCCFTGLWTHHVITVCWVGSCINVGKKNIDTQSSDLLNFHLRPQRVGEREWEGGDDSISHHETNKVIVCKYNMAVERYHTVGLDSFVCFLLVFFFLI